MQNQSKPPIEVFISYSHQDRAMQKELRTYLAALEREGVIRTWYDGEIPPGGEWAKEISEHLNTSQIILLLVSADFINSDFCYGIEMARALERHNNDDAIVIPVILKASPWSGAPFAKLKALPTDGKPIENWEIRANAFTNVAEGIREVIETLKASAPKAVTSPRHAGNVVIDDNTPEENGKLLPQASPRHENQETLLPLAASSNKFEEEGNEKHVLKHPSKPQAARLAIPGLALLLLIMAFLIIGYVYKLPDCSDAQVKGFELDLTPTKRPVAIGEAVTIMPWEVRTLADGLRGRVVFANPDAAKGCLCNWEEKRDNEPASGQQNDGNFLLKGVKGNVRVITLTLRVGSSLQSYSFTINLSPQ